MTTVLDKEILSLLTTMDEKLSQWSVRLKPEEAQEFISSRENPLKIEEMLGRIHERANQLVPGMRYNVTVGRKYSPWRKSSDRVIYIEILFASFYKEGEISKNIRSSLFSFITSIETEYGCDEYESKEEAGVCVWKFRWHQEPSAPE